METLLGRSRDGLVTEISHQGSGPLIDSRVLIDSPHTSTSTIHSPMAKVKKDSQGPSHIRARIDYLRRAAIYLQSPSASGEQVSECVGDQSTTGTLPEIKSSTETAGNNARSLPRDIVTKGRLSQVYISHMRGVSLKAQVRLPIEVKRSFCKRCNTHLIPGVNCTQEMRNDSRGRKKPWADVWVVRCVACGTEKRFPQTEKRSKKLSERKKEKEQKGKEHSAET